MKVKIWVSLLLVYILWGSTYLAIRFAVETIPPFLMAGTRFLIAGSILYLWRRTSGDPAPTRRQWLSATAIGVLLLLGGNGMLSWAEQKVASGVAALLIGSVPLWMAAIEAIRPGGNRPNWLGVLGLVIGFGGIALLVGPSLAGGARQSFTRWGLPCCSSPPSPGRLARSTAAMPSFLDPPCFRPAWKCSPEERA